MKQKIEQLIKAYKKENLKMPTVLFLTPEDLAELREDLGLAPEEDLLFYKTMSIIVIAEDEQT